MGDYIWREGILVSETERMALLNARDVMKLCKLDLASFITTLSCISQSMCHTFAYMLSMCFFFTYTRAM